MDNKRVVEISFSNFFLPHRSKIVKAHTSYDRAFAVVGPKLWNSLPLQLCSITNLSLFKARLRHYVFKLAFQNWVEYCFLVFLVDLIAFKYLLVFNSFYSFFTLQHFQQPMVAVKRFYKCN